MTHDAYSADAVGAIEALLFVSDEPASTTALAEALGISPNGARAALAALQERYEREDSGIQLREAAGGWRLYTHPRHHELVERYVVSWDTRRLSRAALETLAVIAYSQPATRTRVASIRGVNSDSAINSLVEKGLVREAGRDAESPGHPVLYATTRSFLEKFGLASLAELPDIEQFAPDEASRRLIRERLGMVRFQADESEVSAHRDEAELDFAFQIDKGIAADDGFAITEE